MSGRKIAFAAWLATAGLTAMPALAANPPAGDKTDQTAVVRNIDPKDKKVFTFDFGVPSSPALTLLGVDKDKVTQSNSLRPFVLALPSLVNGKESGQAAALDIAPAAYLIPSEDQVFFDEDTKRQVYQGWRARAFRTRTAIGLYNGVSDSDASKQKPSKLSLGLSTSFLDSSDPLLARAPGRSLSAWIACVDAVKPAFEAAAPIPVATADNTAKLAELRDAMKVSLRKITSYENALKDPAASDDVKALLPEALAKEKQTFAGLRAQEKTILEGELPKTAELDKFAKSDAVQMFGMCKKIANRAANLGPDLDFGVGSVWNGTPGKIEHMQHPGAVLWASYRMGLGVKGPASDSYAAYKTWYDKLDQWFMVGLSTRFGSNEEVATGDKTTPIVRADTWSVWLGLERYTEGSRFALQAGEEKTDPRDSAHRTFKGTRGRWQVTYDRRLTDEGLWITATYGEANGTGALKDDKVAKVTFTYTTPDPPKVVGGP